MSRYASQILGATGRMRFLSWPFLAILVGPKQVIRVLFFTGEKNLQKGPWLAFHPRDPLHAPCAIPSFRLLRLPPCAGAIGSAPAIGASGVAEASGYGA